ncbi:MAG: uridine kinase [Pseudohaliea sp.]
MRTYFIAIAGPSASGKTLFAQTLRETVQAGAPGLGLTLISEDSYYRDQGAVPPAERERVNYDHPDALEQDLLLSHLHCLRAGEAVEVPVYDYERHTRAARHERIAPAPVVLVEGILLLAHPGLREFFDIRFFVDTPLDLCLLRRLSRDLDERGRSVADVLRQYEESVRPMYFEYIQPSARHADMVITGGGRNKAALDVVKRLVLSHLAAEPAAPAP